VLGVFMISGFEMSLVSYDFLKSGFEEFIISFRFSFVY